MVFKNRYAGFTLLELSIVMVIIGLLVGGIFVGKDLIEVSQLKGVINQLDSTVTAVATFKLKYNCLPGDCYQASSFFSGATNGNNNGQIGGFADAPDEVAGESYQVWLHLSKAGLIGGSYTGATGPGHLDRNAIPDVNVPILKGFPNGGLFMGYNNNYSWIGGKFYNPDWSLNWTKVSANVIQIGAYMANCCEVSNNLFSPPRAFYLDQKMDDGKPVTGKIVTMQSPATTCFSTRTDWFSPMDYYYLADPSILCAPLIMVLGF